MKIYLKCVVVLVLVLFPATSTSEDEARMPRAVSLVELIANPDRFEGQLILVAGYLGLDPPDGNMIYLHKEDYDHGILFNAVDIELNKEAWVEREKLDLNYVRVVGVFRGRVKAHALYSAITDVQSCTLWSEVSNPFRQKRLRPRTRKPE